MLSPGWCGSVDWGLACKPKGRRFNSQSGHVPGLHQGPSMAGRGGWWEAIDWCISHTSMFPSFFLPSPLSKSKINKIFKKYIKEKQASRQKCNYLEGEKMTLTLFLQVGAVQWRHRANHITVHGLMATASKSQNKQAKLILLCFIYANIGYPNRSKIWFEHEHESR